MQNILSGGKREEEGTTGAFGLGFISVYQITDRPELTSAGLHWTLHPELPENERIEETDVEASQGTQFRFPWAMDAASEVRRRLRVQPVSSEDVKQFAEDLFDAVFKMAVLLSFGIYLKATLAEMLLTYRRKKKKRLCQFWRLLGFPWCIQICAHIILYCKKQEFDC